MSKHRALTICKKKPGNSRENLMERFIPVEIFRKKSNTFGAITFFPFLPKRPKFSVPFVWITSARLHVQRKRKLYRYFVNGTTQSRSCFRCQKNTTNIWRKFFTAIPVQMVSAHKEMRTRLGWTISYKALYFVHQSLGLVPFFVYNNNSVILCSVAEMQSVSALLLNSRSENKRMAVLPVQTVKTNQCFWKKKCSKYINDVLWRSCF